MRPLPRTAALVLGLISVLTCVTIYGFLTRHNTLGSLIATAVLGSLIAAAIISAGAAVLAASSPAISRPDGQLDGLLRITTKGAVGSEKWLTLLHNAKHEFFIAGHSLGRWCSASNEDTFTSNVTRILSAGGAVTLVFLAPGSPQLDRLHKACSTDYTERIRVSLQVLANLKARLSPEQLTRLTISVLNDHEALPYMLVGNEQALITSSYLASGDGEGMPCVQLLRDSDVAKVIYDDFRDLAHRGSPPSLPSPSSATVRPAKRGGALRRLLSGRRARSR